MIHPLCHYLFQSSSVSSDSSFEELRKLATVDEGSERSSSAPGTTPSTQVHASKMAYSPHGGTVNIGRGKNAGSSASRRSEKTEDDELEHLLSILREETGVQESAESQAFTLKPPVATSLATSEERVLQSILQDMPASGDESTSSTPIKPLDHDSVISYDQSPRVFKNTRCGSMPSIVAPEVFEMGDSDSSRIQEGDSKRNKKPARKKRAASESGHPLDHLRAVDDYDDDLVASVSTSRVDAWIQDQNKLHTQSKLKTKHSLDDSSLVSSSRGASLRGTEGSLAVSSTTLTSGQSPSLDKPATSSVSVADRRRAFEVAAPQKPWFNSPQRKHNGSGLASNSPFSSVSHSSTDNSLNGAEKGVRASPPTTQQRDAKHRPTSNLSRDSGYTSREHMGLESTQLPMGLKAKASVSPRTAHMEFRRSPTEPVASSTSVGRRAEFIPQPADVHPPAGCLTHSRSFGPGHLGSEVGSAELNQDQESAGIQPVSHASSAGSIHPPPQPVPPLHPDYSKNDRSYRHAKQMQPRREIQPPVHPFHPPFFPHPSYVSSSARNLCYYSPGHPHFHHLHHHQYQQQRGHHHYQQQVYDYYPNQHGYFNTVNRRKVHKPSPSSFVDQLNQMGRKNTAKSAPLLDNREAKLTHNFNGRVFPGVSAEASDAQHQTTPVYTNRWKRNMVGCRELSMYTVEMRCASQ